MTSYQCSIVSNLSSPACSNVNVMRLFDTNPRRKRSHGHRNGSSTTSQTSFYGLLGYLHQPLGIHHIRTELYAIPLSRLRQLQQQCLDKVVINQSSPEYRLVSIILDIAFNRLDKPKPIIDNITAERSFLKLKFTNKGIDAINISNILHH